MTSMSALHGAALNGCPETLALMAARIPELMQPARARHNQVRSARSTAAAWLSLDSLRALPAVAGVATGTLMQGRWRRAHGFGADLPPAPRMPTSQPSSLGRPKNSGQARFWATRALASEAPAGPWSDHFVGLVIGLAIAAQGGRFGAGIQLGDARRDLGILAFEQRVPRQIAVDEERPEILHLQHPHSLGHAKVLKPVR